AFEPEPLRVRHSPDSYEQHLGFETRRLAFRGLTGPTHAPLSLLELLEFRSDLRLDSAFTKTAFELFRNFLVLERHESRQKLNNRRLRTETRIHRRKLDTDSARSHHDQRLRYLLQLENVIAIDDVLPVSLKPW